MELSEYGLWVDIRNKRIPVQKEFSEQIAMSIQNDLKKEDLDLRSTFSYDLFYHDERLGTIKAIKRNGRYIIGSNLRPLIWLGQIESDERNKLLDALSYIENGLEKTLERLRNEL